MIIYGLNIKNPRIKPEKYAFEELHFFIQIFIPYKFLENNFEKNLTLLGF